MKKEQKKELASTRHHVEIEQHTHHIHTQAPTYSVASLPSTKAIPTEKKVVIPEGSTVAQKDAEYLKHDMVAITAASGIVAAIDVLLFALLSTGFIHLNFYQ
jgi:hypothetical protein